MYEQHQQILENVIGFVRTAARSNGLELDHTFDAHDTVSIGSFRWCDEMVSVQVVDPESKDLKLTFLDGNGCIVGQMSTSNLGTYIAAYAVIQHLSLTV